MAVKKFTRYTKGRNQQVIVPKAVAISADTTLAAFLASATAGKIGVYDAVGALHTNAIVAGESFTIVQKNSDGSVKTTTMVAWNDVTVRRKTYVAPVKAVGSLGWAGTAGSLNLAAAVATGKLYEIAILETTEGNQPFPTWNYEYKAIPNDAEIDVMQGLAKLVNDTNNIIYKSNAALVKVEVKADATYSDYAMGAGGTMTATKGTNTLVTVTGTVNFVVGDYVALSSPGAVVNDAVGDIYKIIGNPDANTWTLNRIFSGETVTYTEANIDSGDFVQKAATFVKVGLVFTALNDEESFRIAVRQELQYADVINLSSYARGNGTSDRIAELELEGNAFAGNTAGNTVYGNEAYGNPDKWVTAGETYDTFNIEATQTLRTVGAPNGYGKLPMSIVIAAPKSAGGLSASLNTLFGT